MCVRVCVCVSVCVCWCMSLCDPRWSVYYISCTAPPLLLLLPLLLLPLPAYDILSDPKCRRAYDSADPTVTDDIPTVCEYSREHFFEVFTPVFEENVRYVWAPFHTSKCCLGPIPCRHFVWVESLVNGHSS